MKYKMMIVGATLLSGALTSSWANQITFANESSPQKSLAVVYAIAHQNAGSPVVLGAPQQLILTNTATVPFDLSGYQLAGVVVISIDGHILPKEYNQFNLPQQCSLTTNAQYSSGTLHVVYTKQPGPGDHGQLRCGVQGGIFQS